MSHSPERLRCHKCGLSGQLWRCCDALWCIECYLKHREDDTGDD